MARAGRRSGGNRWDVFTMAGEDKGFGSPGGLWFDARGLLWIQTDVSTSALNRGPYA
jgi:secreted PhoX family phosphatase